MFINNTILHTHSAYVLKHRGKLPSHLKPKVKKYTINVNYILQLIVNHCSFNWYSNC